MKYFVYSIILIFFTYSCTGKENTEQNNIDTNIDIPYSLEELNKLPSLWQIITEDARFLIEDRGTRPPPRYVVVKNLENGEIIFFGNYYEKINLHGYTIEIDKHYGEYYAGKWSVSKKLDDIELNFGKNFLEENEPPEELVRIADLAQGNGLALSLTYEYNFVTKEKKIIEGRYYRTM